MSSLKDIVIADHFTAKLVRHLLFWMGQFMFWAFVVTGIFVDASTIDYLKGDLRLHSYFIPDMIYTYVVAYYLVNRFLLKRHYRKFLLALSALTLAVYVIFLFFRFWDYNMFESSREQKLLMIWLYSMKFISLGPPVTCAMFLSLKFLKNYHRKVHENKSLIRENARSQLGLLKAQIHPHFLFNTLSNIHSFALTRPEVASDLVSRLSATMKYMILDCEAPVVCLDKELRMIKDYTELEKVRYSNSLTINFKIKGDVSNKKIAPLFLIPLIENAFKHGTSQVLTNPWIHIGITVSETCLSMDLRNSKPAGLMARNHRSGIGLMNVRKRLQLLYPNDHKLMVDAAEHEFSVHIQLPLFIAEPAPLTNNPAIAVALPSL